MTRNHQENEVKFYVRDLGAIEARLIEKGAEKTQPRLLEINLRFDAADGSLESQHRVLRLRQDSRARLTYKGQQETHEGVLVRQEIEVEVDDFSSAQELLEALGYHVSMIYEKYRTVYVWEEVEVALDELPFGCFVEIEGMTVENIQRVARALGLDWGASVPFSYAVLFQRLRKRLGLSFRDLTFENFHDLHITPLLLEVQPADEERN